MSWRGLVAYGNAASWRHQSANISKWPKKPMAAKIKTAENKIKQIDGKRKA